MNDTTFKALPIYAQFHFAPWNVTKEGREEFITCETYHKISARKYKGADGRVYQVGTINVKVRVGRWYSKSSS